MHSGKSSHQSGLAERQLNEQKLAHTRPEVIGAVPTEGGVRLWGSGYEIVTRGEVRRRESVS